MTFDLRSGYHHIDIHPDSQTFLGFCWKGKYYKFTVLPFGLSSACFVFTKVMRPLVKYWRGLGMWAVIYIDDGIVLASSQEECIEVGNIGQSSLEQAGFLWHIEKSNWEPAQVGRGVG